MSSDLVKFLNQYKFEHVIKSTGEKIHFKPITTGQIKALLVYEGHDNATSVEDMFDDLINGCVITEGFNVNKLNLQDRFDLLLEIRKQSKGDVYEFLVKCPKCDNESHNFVSINSMEVIPYKEPKDKIKLSDDLQVKLGHVTRGQQKEVLQLLDNFKGSDNQRLIETSMLIYAHAMKKFYTPAGDMEDVSLMGKKELLENLTSEAYKDFQKWFEDNDYGVKFEYELKCKTCGFSETRKIPIQDFFA